MRSLLRLAPLSSVSLFVVVAVFGCSSEKGKAADPGMSPPASIACAATPVADIGTNFFGDISESSGIQKDNFVASPTTAIPINDHSRLAFADLDGDGFDDIVAHSLYPNALKGIPFEHLVFLNNHDKTFRDFSDESGLRGVQAGFFTFGDVDNDGDQDCFAGLDIALAGQTSSLWLNDGKGHFTKKEGSGLEKAALSANGVFADFNGDAILDLYSGNGGTADAVADQLFFGVGDGTFTLTTKNLGLQALQPTNGVVTCDYDDDGDLDIFVSHYGVSIELGWKTLWQNDGTGTFTNVAKSAGFHALATGNYYLASTGNGTMVQPGDPSTYVGSNGFGIDCQDIDGDGHMDIWLATISHPVDTDESRKWSDPSQLLLNKGGSFSNVFLDRGLPFNEGDIDAAAVDFDNDGHIDLSVTRDSKYESNYTTPDQMSWFGLMHQGADGMFTSVGLNSGINDPTGTTNKVKAKAGQNLGWSDIDGDGDLDLLVGGRDDDGKGRANFLFENTIGQKNGWLGVRLRGDGTKINRDAIGARVTLSIGDTRIVREVKSSRGTYSSADSRALSFGLGEKGCSGTTSLVAMDVRWPNGETKHYDAGSFALNRYLTIDYAKGLLP